MSVKDGRKTINTMKKLFLLLIMSLFFYLGYSQDDSYTGLQLTVGYTPKQVTSLNDKGNAVSFDIMGIEWFNDFNDPVAYGLGYGLGIRSYNKIDNNAILNSEDPYKQSVTRFDVHIGPAMAVGVTGVALLLSPQFGLWYAGMSNDGPKINFTTTLSADLVFGIISVGISYSALSRRLVSTNWSIYNPENSYILIKPALEFRAGIAI
ncbi:hypothetical protein TRIP_D310114 [uncultured Paludibacter sp.]|nr:hypothetical protein TRIP_D310114 [uncultured Paludibacter sp.]